MKLLAISVFLLLIQLLLLKCHTAKEISIDKMLTGSWKIDSVYIGKQIDSNILPDYTAEMDKFFSNSLMELNKDNTFIFSFAGNKLEGTWFTTDNEKLLITHGFGERLNDTFYIDLKGHEHLTLSSQDSLKPVKIFLSKIN